MSRPTNLLEALARAGGLQNGNLDGAASELADLERSFVIRRGKKLDVDMAALYLQGNFHHNILLEPGDYIYVASLVRSEIYVLGQLANPGLYSYRPGMTATGAIAAAGGFTPVAWRNRVLVVRGRLQQPETHVVELNRVLHDRGGRTDLPLEPGDIVFVSTQPWGYAAQILAAVLLAYIDGSVAGFLAEGDVGFSVGPGF